MRLTNDESESCNQSMFVIVIVFTPDIMVLYWTSLPRRY